MCKCQDSFGNHLQWKTKGLGTNLGSQFVLFDIHNLIEPWLGKNPQTNNITSYAERDWTTSSNFSNYTTLNSEHNWKVKESTNKLNAQMWKVSQHNSYFLQTHILLLYNVQVILLITLVYNLSLLHCICLPISLR